MFSTFEANIGYCQIKIDEADRVETAVKSHHGHFRFIRMHFALHNVPGTFQLKMDVVLSTVKWNFAIVFLEDIIVFSKSPDEHIEQVSEIFFLLCDASVTLKLKTCRFFSDAIDNLSHVKRPIRLEIATYTTNAIRQLQQKKSLTKRCSFPRLYILLQCYVPNLVRIAAALNKCL